MRPASDRPARRGALQFYPGQLVPAIGVLREAGTLHPYDAEALAGGRLHHHPALQAIHHLGAQLLKARHFGRDVVGLDVQVDATFVFHTLDLHDRLIGRGLQHAIVAAAARMVWIHSAAQCLAPEARGLIHVGASCSRSTRRIGGNGASRSLRRARQLTHQEDLPPLHCDPQWSTCQHIRSHAKR